MPFILCCCFFIWHIQFAICSMLLPFSPYTRKSIFCLHKTLIWCVLLYVTTLFFIPFTLFISLARFSTRVIHFYGTHFILFYRCINVYFFSCCFSTRRKKNCIKMVSFLPATLNVRKHVRSPGTIADCAHVDRIFIKYICFPRNIKRIFYRG